MPNVTDNWKRVADLGKVGGPIALKQLYDSLVPKDASAQADYVDPLFNTAAMNPASTYNPYAAAPKTDSGLDYFKSMFAKEGGAIRHYNEGGTTVDPTQSSDTIENRIAAIKNADYQRQVQDLQEAFKSLGDAAPTAKPTQPAVARVQRPGASYAPRPLQQMSVVPQLAAILQQRGMHLAQGGNVDDQSHPNYAGIPAFRTGGLDGLGGKYVEGKGDGTSDDIAAMLANGEYVFSADVVAALGNGSNKAGASALDQMVSKIRQRARSAPPDKLSPDAKSPLEYLKSAAPTKGAR
jgi:hypothetical protein